MHGGPPTDTQRERVRGGDCEEKRSPIAAVFKNSGDCNMCEHRRPLEGARGRVLMWRAGG